MIETLTQLFRKELQDVNKHYDLVENDIDIHVETMIQTINKYRQTLIDDLQARRKQSVEQIELLRNEIKENEEQAEKIYKETEYIKQSCWYFVPSPEPFELKDIGYTLNNFVDRTFLKMKNLKEKLHNNYSNIADNSDRYPLVNLEEVGGGVSLRQNTIPLSASRTVSVDLTTSQNLNLHTFDSSTGRIIKSFTSFEKHLASFPVSHGCGNRFVVCYAVKSDHNQFRSTTNRICLFDDKLNLIKSHEYIWSIESVFMTHSHIVLIHPNRSDKMCSILDHGFSEVQRFGQNMDTLAPFFMPKHRAPLTQMGSSGHNRQYPAVFGLTDEHVYLYNQNEMNVLCRDTGASVERRPITTGDKPFFMLDSQHNVVQINKPSRRATLFSIKHDFKIEAEFTDAFDTICLTQEKDSARDAMVFINNRNRTLKFI